MLFKVTIALLCSHVGWGIIGGQPAPNYPIFAVVKIGGYTCGGSIVKLDAVLTAAHCLYFDKESRWASPIEVRVLQGDFSRPNNWTVRYYSREKIIVHYKYDAASNRVRQPYDVALIKLGDQVRAPISSQPKVIPLCSYDGHTREKSLFGKVIGLGPTRINPTVRAERLMETSLMKIDCRNHEFSDHVIFPSEKCYRFLQGSSLTDNDFGGPIVAYKSGGRVSCLIGCASYANYVIDGYFTSIFTSADRIKLWMNKNYRKNFTDFLEIEESECQS